MADEIREENFAESKAQKAGKAGHDRETIVVRVVLINTAKPIQLPLEFRGLFGGLS